MQVLEYKNIFIFEEHTLFFMNTSIFFEILRYNYYEISYLIANEMLCIIILHIWSEWEFSVLELLNIAINLIENF